MGNVCSYEPSDESEVTTISFTYDGVVVEAPTVETIVLVTYTLVDTIKIKITTYKKKIYLYYSDLKTEVVETKWNNLRLYRGILALSPCSLFLNSDNAGFFIYGNKTNLVLTFKNE